MVQKVSNLQKEHQTQTEVRVIFDIPYSIFNIELKIEYPQDIGIEYRISTRVIFDIQTLLKIILIHNKIFFSFEFILSDIEYQPD